MQSKLNQTELHLSLKAISDIEAKLTQEASENPNAVSALLFSLPVPVLKSMLTVMKSTRDPASRISKYTAMIWEKELQQLNDIAGMVSGAKESLEGRFWQGPQGEMRFALRV